MQVAILAGGMATRLRPLTEAAPKSLIRIRGKPFLEYQLDSLKQSGVQDVVLCLGYLGEQIEGYFGAGKQFGVSISYSYDGERLLGTGGALKNAEGLFEDKFFVMYGDSYLSLDFAAVKSYFNDRDKLGLMVVYKNYERYDRSNAVIEGNLVKKYSKKEKTPDMVYIDYGTSMLRKEALALVPPAEVFPLEELFTELIKREELLAYEVSERFYQIGTPEGLEEFKEYIALGEKRQ